MSKRSKLKDTKIYLNDDMDKYMRLIDENLSTIRKQLKEKGIKAMISKGHVLVNEISYTIQDVDDLGIEGLVSQLNIYEDESPS